jgi:hypothetical protein
MATIIIVCCYCGKVIGEKDGKGQEGISHGICEACTKEVYDVAG